MVYEIYNKLKSFVNSVRNNKLFKTIWGYSLKYPTVTYSLLAASVLFGPVSLLVGIGAGLVYAVQKNRYDENIQEVLKPKHPQAIQKAANKAAMIEAGHHFKIAQTKQDSIDQARPGERVQKLKKREEQSRVSEFDHPNFNPFAGPKRTESNDTPKKSILGKFVGYVSDKISTRAR
jgi:hypothetical protein